MSMRRRLALIVLVAVLDAVLFGISGLPRYRNASGDTTDGVIAEIVWLGFLAGALTLIVVGVRAVVVARRRTTTPR